jgi:hypothetical protein
MQLYQSCNQYVMSYFPSLTKVSSNSRYHYHTFVKKTKNKCSAHKCNIFYSLIIKKNLSLDHSCKLTMRIHDSQNCCDKSKCLKASLWLVEAGREESAKLWRIYLYAGFWAFGIRFNNVIFIGFTKDFGAVCTFGTTI